MASLQLSVRRVVLSLCGTAGVVVAGAAVVRYLRGWLRRVVASNLEQNIEDAISNEALAELAKSSNIGLRQSAEQMLLDRITKWESFSYVLTSCRSDDEEKTLKACTALCVILKSVDQRMFHVDTYILENLLSTLCRSMDRRRHFKTHMPEVDFPEKIQRMTLATIYDFSSSPGFLSKLEQMKTPDVGSIALELLQTSRNKEVQRYSLLLLLQMTMQGKNFAGLEAFRILAQKCVAFHGDLMLQKICFQLLVTMINAQSTDATSYVHEIAKHKILVPMVVSTKSEDVEISFWAVALLHEFAVHNVYRSELCALPYLIKNLQSTLMASEAGVQRLVLRVLAFLALRNDSFKSELLKNSPLIGHLPTCLASGNKDVVHWALVLVHDLAMMGRKALEALLDGTNDAIMKSLLSLSSSRDTVMLRLLAETLGLFCGCEQLHPRLVRAGSLEMILGLAQSHDPDLVFWSSALLLNLAMTSDAVKAEILSIGGLKTLIDLSLGDHDNSQITTMAAKTLVMMAVLDEPVHLHVRCETDASSVEIHEKKLQLTHTGVNAVLWETLLDKRLQVWHTEVQGVEGELDYTRLVNIPILGQQSSRTCECNVVIFTINGEHAPGWLKALGDQLRVGINSKTGHMTSQVPELEEGQCCCVVAMVNDNRELDVIHIAKGPADVKLQISGARVVNQRIRQLILKPLLHRIVAVPANSPINRVLDLELLEVLVRPEAQKDLVLECRTIMDQLSAMVSYFAQQGVDQLKSEPLAAAHCHGALRVLRVLAMYDHYRTVLLSADVVPSVVQLLNGLVHFWLSAILTTQGLVGSRPISRMGPDSRPVSRAGFRPRETPTSSFRPQSRGAAGANGLGEDDKPDEVDLMSTTDSLTQMEHSIAQAVTAISHTVQQLAATQPPLPHPQRNRRLRSSSDTISTATDNNLAAEIEETEDKSEEGQMTNHLSKFAVLTLAHLLNTEDQDMSSTVQSALHLSGAMQVLWASLLCSSDQLRTSLMLPLVTAMTKLAATDIPSNHRDFVRLDIGTKTPALLVSTDCMEVYNDTWTFESIRATHPVPALADGEACPEGWYFEVELKSSGIIQIGWATQQCQFGPEKGVGVGDDINSCAFDGARCRKWNGPITETLNNEYGLEWQVGDVVSCLMDRHGNASFWLRGINMGVAFPDLDLTKSWYPACSLSTDQHIKFNFGDSAFRYSDLIPAGYVPFVHAQQQDKSEQMTAKSDQQQRQAKFKQPKNASSQDCKRDGLSESPQLYKEQLLQGDASQGMTTEDSNDAGVHHSLQVTSELAHLQESGRLEDVVFGHTNFDVDVDNTEGQTEFDADVDNNSSGEGNINDFGYSESSMGGEAFAEMTDSPRHVVMAKIAEVDASLNHPFATQQNVGIGGIKHEPVRSVPLGAGDHSDGLMGSQLGVTDTEGGGEAEEFQPPPSLYYEVNVRSAHDRPVMFGYCNEDASIQVYVILTEDGELIFPDQTIEKAPDCPVMTIGCALLSPPGVVFFTINGQPIKRLFSLLKEDQPMPPLTPCTNSPYLSVNFGQENFSYEPANDFDQRIFMAALLHDFCEQTLNA